MQLNIYDEIFVHIFPVLVFVIARDWSSVGQNVADARSQFSANTVKSIPIFFIKLFIWRLPVAWTSELTDSDMLAV